jgi:molybdopterin adenylyltransferase
MAISVGILTVSDRCYRGEAEDASSPLIGQWVTEELGGQVKRQDVVPDERDLIQETLVSWSDEHELDLILTTGGTGFALRDVTPEATRAIIEREVPGLAEAMRLEGIKKTPHAMLSRATAGIRGQTLIVNLPGSPKAVREGLGVILPALPHGIEILKGVHGADRRHEYKR